MSDEDDKKNFDIQIKHLKDAAGLLRTVDLPALIAQSTKHGTSDDLLLLMGLNAARAHLPMPAKDPEQP